LGHNSRNSPSRDQTNRDCIERSPQQPHRDYFTRDSQYNRELDRSGELQRIDDSIFCRHTRMLAGQARNERFKIDQIPV
jgi:hypothetical protein